MRFTSNLGTGFDGVAKAVAVQPNGQRSSSGLLHTSQPNMSRLARLNADGNPDNDFQLNLGTGVTTTPAGVRRM